MCHLRLMLACEWSDGDGDTAVSCLTQDNVVMVVDGDSGDVSPLSCVCMRGRWQKWVVRRLESRSTTFTTLYTPWILCLVYG